MPQRLGIFGGTFDPVHIGHLRIAEEAVDRLCLDRLLFVPAALPPHKVDRVTQSFEHRLAMLELAVADNPRFRVSSIEGERPGRSYTVATLRRMHAEATRCVDFFFLVGMDGFLDLGSWWHYRELFQLARIVVLDRPGCHGPGILGVLRQGVSPFYETGPDGACFVHPYLHPVYALRNTRLEVSSSEIRRLVGEGRSIRYLVPEDVLHYILKYGLYRPTVHAG